MKRRQFLGAVSLAATASAIAKPAIAQSMPELRWRLTSSFPKSLDTLYGAAEAFAKAVAEATDNNAAPDPDEVAAADMLTEAKSGARLSLAKRSGTKKVAVVSGKAPKAPSDRAKSHSKQDRIVALLQRPKGATLEALANETQWQKHSVRGFLAGTVRKKLKLSLLSEKIEGIRTYRIGTGKAAKSKKTSAGRKV